MENNATICVYSLGSQKHHLKANLKLAWLNFLFMYECDKFDDSLFLQEIVIVYPVVCSEGVTSMETFSNKQ